MKYISTSVFDYYYNFTGFIRNGSCKTLADNYLSFPHFRDLIIEYHTTIAADKNKIHTAVKILFILLIQQKTHKSNIIIKIGVKNAIS